MKCIASHRTIKNNVIKQLKILFVFPSVFFTHPAGYFEVLIFFIYILKGLSLQMSSNNFGDEFNRLHVKHFWPRRPALDLLVLAGIKSTKVVKVISEEIVTLFFADQLTLMEK